MAIYNNKVIYNGETLIDLTADTVVPEKLAQGYTAHDMSGAPIVGTNTYDSDTSDATAVDSEILATKTAYVNGNKITGTMPNRGAVTGYISDVSTKYTIQNGYHDGSGTVEVDTTEAAKIIPSNIKSGVQILGVTGTYSGEAITAQVKQVTPTAAGFSVLPDVGYDYLSQVDVAAVPVTTVLNAQGGNTVAILPTT